MIPASDKPVDIPVEEKEEPKEKEDTPDKKKNVNNHNYKSMELGEFTIHYTDEAMDKHGKRMLKWMNDGLNEIERLVPSDAWNVLKTTDIWINDRYTIDGQEKGGACVHWGEGWLRWKNDLPEKADDVEFYNIGNALNYWG